jgi:DNA polymerase-3 subunit delta'
MALAGTHPDITLVSKPEDKSDIPLDAFLGTDERRGREGMCHAIALKPYLGGRKIALIDDADHLNIAGANCLLKTLEEPPPRSVIVLIGTSPAKQLPTIRSRCQLLRFSPLNEEVVAELLVSQNLVGDAEEARRLARFSEGSLQRALEMADPDLWSWRGSFLNSLAERPLRSAVLAQTVSAFVDEAGKEAALRRNRLRQIVLFASQYYRQAMVAAAGETNDASVDAPAACLERCMEALRQIDRNANQTTLIEAWLDDLACGKP